MRDRKRAVAEQHQRDPRSREAPGGEPVRVWLLGGFRVSVGPRSIGEEGWRLKKAGNLLKLLALAPKHRLHREQAMELLWPDLDQEAAANNLHYALHVARRTLEPGAQTNAASRHLALREDLLVLCPDGSLWVDVEAFEGAAATARRSRQPAAYRAALELYAGDLLPEDLYEEWSRERREGLRGSYYALLSELAALHQERGEYGAAIEASRRVVAGEPANEEAHAGLMRLYTLSGRRHEAILQYERLREALREELDQEPGEAARRLYEEVRAGKFPVASSPAAGRPSEEPLDPSPNNNLPASLTSFIGREDALLEVKRLLAMTRLLTLTGSGGTGKTRLALEVARDLVGAYPEGVRLVELAPLSEAALAPQAVAQALGVREQPGRSLPDTLVDHLRMRELLLVVDNCEHLVDAVAHLVEALLRSCPKLRVLATSREPLGVPGEALLPVPPLSIPEVNRAFSIGGLMSTEAIRLFLDRTRSRLPDFELKAENAGAVGRICRKLEGMPLAIELACARMGALAVEQVAQRLEDSLKLLTGGGRTVEPRQRTLRATLDWSFELLSGPERRLFGRLSVFAGGWTLEAAEEVCSGEGTEREEVLDLLSGLVDKSLVMAERKTGGALRYRMLEPVRQYGRERLEENGESEQIREWHAGYYLALAERVEPELVGSQPAAWLEVLETEYANLRAALSWLLDDERVERAKVGLRLAAALGRFWDAQGPGEGRRWLEKGLARSGSSPPSPVRAKALNEAGFIAVYEGDPEAMALLEEGLALYKELGDKSGMASSMSSLGHAVVHVGNRERMLSLREEVEALLSESLKDRRVRAHLLVFLGLAAASEMDFEQMRFRLEEALALFRELGDIRGVATCLPISGYNALAQDDPERAAALFEEGLNLQRKLKQKTHIFMGLLGMGAVAVLRGHPVRASKLIGASEALRGVIGLSLTSSSWKHYDFEDSLAAARARLGGAAFEAAFSEGQAMSPEQAIEYALSKGEESPTTLVPAPEQPPEPSVRLTSREQEVALLVGRGLTNRRIADALAISEHTVAAHVRKILEKLGLRSRAQISNPD